jgi:iron(III) transport system substrate-binding protein
MFALLMFACSTDAPAPAEAPPEAATPAGPVTIYSGRSESLMGPIFEKIGDDLGIELDVQYGDTAQMVTRLATEGDTSPADLILAQEVGHLDVLAEQGRLSELPADLVSAVDPRFVDPDKHWVGTSGRLRVVVVDSQAVAEADRPQSLKELADPKWKGKLGWAPTNGSMQSHLGALCSLWGEDETRTWLKGVMANEPRRYPKNSPQVDAADKGEIAVGWVNHYYLHRKSDRSRAINHSFPAEHDAGNILMLAGGAVPTTAPHADQAVQVLEALVSQPSQAYFAQETFEYPVVKGVPTHAKVPGLDTISLAEVDPTALTDLRCARKLLDEADLL